jgi:curli biogenesis system outer membrane secretion channel CsgG
MGKTFASLRNAVDDFDLQGFVIQGRFERSQWPATVVFEKESLNEISFVLKSGVPHTYSGYDGYRLKVVVLEDAVHDETVLVFRTKNRKAPATGVAPVNRPALSPEKELDRQLENLVGQVNANLAARQASRIAVMEFSNLDGSVSGLGKYLAEELTTRLFRNGKVQIVERQLLNRTLEEQKLSAYGMVDQKTAKAFGSLFGADAILTGTVSELDENVRIHARLIAAQTGEVFAAASVTVPIGREVEGLMGRGPRSGTGRTENMVILAKSAWQNIVNVSTGQTVMIRASGQWNHGEPGYGAYSPQGSGKMDNGVPLPEANVGMLIGRIGHGQPFAIGADKTFTPTVSGMLQLCMNDWGFDNNTGSVNVRIEVK